MIQTNTRLFALAALLALTALIVGCGRTETRDISPPPQGAQPDHGHDHDHDDGEDHDHDHEHDEHPLGTVMILDMEIEGAQSHGAVEPGKLCHLVIKLPYNDGGQTIVRAWIGTGPPDRDLYYVGRGDYAASHDDYDIHVEAPDPLPDDARWWIEIERPDGTRGTGSLPILRDVR
jgi:hypothetical protein